MENIGYTAGMNRLMLTLDRSSPYAILLNQDVQLMPDAVERAVAFMDAHPRCAIAGFKLIDEQDHDFILHGGTGQALPYGVMYRGSVKAGDWNESKPYDWVQLAAGIVRLDFARDCGLMNEAMFNIGSDSEWCYRAWASGRWESWYCAEAVATHTRFGCSADPDIRQIVQNDLDMDAWGTAIKQLANLPGRPSPH